MLLVTPYELSLPPVGNFVSGQGKENKRNGKVHRFLCAKYHSKYERSLRKNKPELTHQRKKKVVTKIILQESESDKEKKNFRG